MCVGGGGEVYSIILISWAGWEASKLPKKTTFGKQFWPMIFQCRLINLKKLLHKSHYKKWAIFWFKIHVEELEVSTYITRIRQRACTEQNN